MSDPGSEVLPIFPLDQVLLPGSPLPLRIFEPRYKQMIDDCYLDGSPFGVCLAHPHLDVMGWRAPSSYGCSAVFDEIDELGSNLALLARGHRRFEVLEIIPPVLGPLASGDVFPSVDELMEHAVAEDESAATGKLYIRARVRWLEQVSGSLPSARWRQILHHWQDWMMELVTAMGIPVNVADIDTGSLQPEEDPTASTLYSFTKAIAADGHDLQQILEADSIEGIAEVLDVVVQRRPPDFQGLDFTLESE